jgi:predicted ATPase
VELLERDGEREALEAAIAESRSAGRVVVVAGEAGIGKTALVSSLADSHRVLWGACDPLITPRPMGPLRDVARETGGALAEAVQGSREDFLSAVLDELRAPAALVVEDLHWADDATLDFVALPGRRLPRSRGCLILTCRPELRPEVRRVLAALPRWCVRTIRYTVPATASNVTRGKSRSASLTRCRAGRLLPVYTVIGR